MQNNEQYVQKIKREIINVYTAGLNRCMCCHESQIAFLTIVADSKKTGYNLYLDIRKRGYPPDVKILCYNCRLVSGTCPHEQARQQLVQRAKKK